MPRVSDYIKDYKPYTLRDTPQTAQLYPVFSNLFSNIEAT
jgi:hypothetical protein